MGNYIVIEKPSLRDLEDTVNNFLNKGYTVSGGIAVNVNNGKFYQAMVKK